MQIRTRLTLQFAILVATILLVAVAVIYYTAANYRKIEFSGRLKARAQTTADLYFGVEGIDSTMLRTIDEHRTDALAHEKITLFDPQNRPVYTNNDTLDFAIEPAQLAEIRSLGELEMVLEEFELVGLRYSAADGDYVIIAGAIDLFGMKKLQSRRRILLVVFLGGLIMVCVVGWVYAGRALRPINQIVEKMKLISANNLDDRLAESKGVDEIGRLAQTFNEMLTRLENAFDLQKMFVANISHELQNPLTAITSQLEVALLRQRDVADYQRTLQSVLEDIQNLNRASSTLLDLASLNAEQVLAAVKPIRVDELLWTCRERLLANHPEFQVEIEMNLPEDEHLLVANANDYLLGIAFGNLMENGCKFSPDKRVRVELATIGTAIKVRVVDNGVGIPPEDLKNIFQPFFRGENASRARGHGIGLSLVHRILELHHATITVDSKVGVGTTFKVMLRGSDERQLQG